MMAKRKEKKGVERVKTRKELRKDKRLQKKENRVHFQKRKKELKLEHKERVKQKKNGKKTTEKSNKEIKKNSKNLHGSDENECEISAQLDDDGGEEIESDFQFTDEELEEKTKAVTERKSKPVPRQPTQLELDHQRLLKQERALRKDMGKQRIAQLKSANEDEDKTIRKLEKMLKIDKTKSKKNVPRMFNDGLDYALEMCLPENIEKMYAAAKEAADAEEESDSEWKEDFALATEKVKELNPKTPKVTKSDACDSVTVVDKKKVERRLRKIEKKYFNESDDDEISSNLSGIDSELEADVSSGGSENDGNDFDENGVQSENDINDNELDEESDSEAPEEMNTITKSSSKRTREKLEKRKLENELKQNTKKIKISHEADESDSEQDELSNFDDYFGDDSDDGLNELAENLNADSDNNNDLDNSSNNSVTDNEEYDKHPKIWEDIYGRKRDQDGNVIDKTLSEARTQPNFSDKYVPPHMRARLAENDKSMTANESDMDPKRIEKLMRLKKLLKGYMNRLSEANMHKIATDIDNLYMQNARYDMNNTLTTLICDALITHSLAPERMVIEHMMLVSVLHANVGIEVGAHMLEVVIDRFNGMIYNGIEQYEVDDKTLDNLVFILSHMYTFKIFQHNLVYEILNKLAEVLCEKSVECLLLVLRSVGFALRKDDPVALKDLILTLQKKSSEAPAEMKNNSRLKYMLDVLLAIKNNNVNKIPQYDPTLAEHFRKVLKTLFVNGKYMTTLNITLDDLINVEQRGKWWVIGSAWTGNIKDIGGASKAIASKKGEQKFSQQLLELARKQRMNTDERRNVFCVLMSAEDYIDAFEKLLHLAIKDHRVIVSVIIHCCLSEETFNPYYAVVMQKFCDFDRKYQLAVQFSVWDRIKDINSHTSVQLRNLAQFLVHLVTNGALPLSIIKIVEFGDLDKVTLRFVRQILLGVLLGKEEICKEVFQRIAPSPKLKAFKDCVRLFMHHFLLKGGAKNGVAANQMNLLKQRVKLVDKLFETSSIQF